MIPMIDERRGSAPSRRCKSAKPPVRRRQTTIHGVMSEDRGEIKARQMRGLGTASLFFLRGKSERTVGFRSTLLKNDT
jgi:hypothetical protein